MSQSTAIEPEKKESVSSTAIERDKMSSARKIPQIKMPRSKIPTNLNGRGISNADPSVRSSTEDTSKGNSSNSSRRQSAKSPVPINKKAVSSSQRKILENQLMAKKIRYTALKDDLTTKQKKAIEMIEEISKLREKIVACGAVDPGPVDEIKLIEISTFKQFDNSLTTPSLRDDSKNHAAEIKIDTSVVDSIVGNLENSVGAKEFLEKWEIELRQLPKRYQEFCETVLDKYISLTTLLTNYANFCEKEDGNYETVNFSAYVQQIEVYHKDAGILKKRLEDLNAAQAQLVEELLSSSHDLCEESNEFRAKIKELATIVINQKQMCDYYENSHQDLQVEQERQRRNQLESQLSSARVKIRDLEAHLADRENKLQQQQASLKVLEEKQRNKEQMMEKRIKDMQRSLKNNDNLVASLEKQRDTFEASLVDFKKKMSIKDSETTANINQLSDQLEEVTAIFQKEMENRAVAEAAALAAEERCKKIEEKCRQLCEITQNKDFCVTESNRTQNEIHLYNELKVARKELAEYKEKQKQLQDEKDEIVAMMNQAASEDNDDETKTKKLVAELAMKSENIKNLATKCMKFERDAIIAQQKNEVLERQLMSYQNKLQAQMSDGAKGATDIYTIELQQQINDLSDMLVEKEKQIEGLEHDLLEKTLEVEERDRALREGSKILQIKEELMNIMKAQENNDSISGETSNANETCSDMEEVDKQILVKTATIQQLHTTLQNKQLQVMRLEKMVKQMEDQQERAQAQRTRFENRIAQLELALQGTCKDRNKGFGIL